MWVGSQCGVVFSAAQSDLHTAQGGPTGVQPPAEPVAAHAEESAGAVAPFLQRVLQVSTSLQPLTVTHLVRQHRV